MQLQGNYSVLNDAIPNFYLNVEGEEQSGCTNTEATNYNIEATQDDGSCISIASSNQVTTCDDVLSIQEVLLGSIQIMKIIL